MSQWFAVAANENVPLTSCDHRKRDKLQETCPSVLLFRNMRPLSQQKLPSVTEAYITHVIEDSRNTKF